MGAEWSNKLYYGDNLDILREHIADESVDLIYLDPPFNSKADYNVLFKTSAGEASAAQAGAFKDTWEWDEAAAEAMHEIMMSPRIPTNLRKLMEALKVFLTGDTGKRGNSMMAYLCMMALRLVELHRVLKPTGSLYLHCDPTASHYIKLILDAVFGMRAFRSEISWKRSTAHNDATQGRKELGHVRDVIFFYTKGPVWTWNQLYTPYSAEYINSAYRLVDKAGRRYQKDNLTAAKPGGDVSYDWPVKRKYAGTWQADLDDEYRNPKEGWEYKQVPPYHGRYWAYSKANMRRFEEEGKLEYADSGMPRYKRFLDEMPGVPLQNNWEDITPALGHQALGYPTQKPEALLERIILASSNEGEVILDPFCGCGTTIAVAERLNRKWIGIDVTYVSVDLMERRLIDMFTPEHDVNKLASIPVPKRRQALKDYWSKGEDTLMIGIRTGLRPYEVIGDPRDFESAKFLAENDKYQFEWWAIRMLGANGKEYKKGADRGIDGWIRFQDSPGDYKLAVISVKGGNTTPGNALRDLRGTMEREKAVSGILITLVPPTGPMKKEIADAGRWNSTLHPERSFPVLQVLTAQDLLDGKMMELPSWGFDTGGRAAKVSQKSPKQASLLDEE